MSGLGPSTEFPPHPDMPHRLTGSPRRFLASSVVLGKPGKGKGRGTAGEASLLTSGFSVSNTSHYDPEGPPPSWSPPNLSLFRVPRISPSFLPCPSASFRRLPFHAFRFPEAVRIYRIKSQPPAIERKWCHFDLPVSTEEACRLGASVSSGLPTDIR